MKFTDGYGIFHADVALHFCSNLITNGQRRPLPTRVEEFLRHDGAVLAAVLRSETPLSINAITNACHEYAAEHPETAVGLNEQTLPTRSPRPLFISTNTNDCSRILTQNKAMEKTCPF